MKKKLNFSDKFIQLRVDSGNWNAAKRTTNK